MVKITPQSIHAVVLGFSSAFIADEDIRDDFKYKSVSSFILRNAALVIVDLWEVLISGCLCSFCCRNVEGKYTSANLIRNIR